MPDIQIRQFNSLLEMRQTAALPGTMMDWLQTDLGLSEEEELATAVRLALGTDATADEEEILPDIDSTDRRGWWGDFDAEEIWDGWPIGCKNWLLLRAKISDRNSFEGDTVLRAENYTRLALQPFIAKRIASRVEVSAVRVGRSEINVLVTMYRGPLSTIQLRFAYLWDRVITT